MKFFTYDRDNESLVLNVPEILLTKEFAKLLELGRNKTKNDKTGKNKESILGNLSSTSIVAI